MKILKQMLTLTAVLMMCIVSACAEEYVPITDLYQQAQEGWSNGTVVIPTVDRLPVLTVESDSVTVDNPYVLTVGTFDEQVSGKFQNSLRYGRIPAYTDLENGLSLENAQEILNEELNRLLGKSIDDYGLIWTEIAEWKNMETWLLYYGQKIAGATCFNAGLTLDVRTEAYHHLIIPHWQAAQMIHDDVPLAPWSVVKETVETYLQGKNTAGDKVLELGYLMQADSLLLVPVWHLSYMASNGYHETYFSAQTAEEIAWWEGRYQLPEPFGWK